MNINPRIAVGFFRNVQKKTLDNCRFRFMNVVGIRPADAPGFIVAQLAGSMAATLRFRWLVPSLPKDAAKVVVAHPQRETTHAR